MATNNSTLPNPQELEIPTAENWLAMGTIRVTDTGSENTYYTDQFDREYFCKNYPQPEPPKVPEWIDQDISPSTIAAVNQSDCSSGAYMPAVEYHTAGMTMAVHGDDVLQFLEDMTGELPTPPSDICWSGLAVFYLSRAVELFCAIHSNLADWEDDEPIRSAA